MVSNPSNKIKFESIDGVILRLLGLKSGVEIDYQTYHDIIKKKLAIARLAGKELPREEDELLREEFKKVRRKKDKGIRFKVKEIKVKSKTTSTPPDQNQKKLTGSGAIVKYKKQSITPSDLVPVKVEDVTEEKKDNFSQIKKTLDSILNILSSKFKFDKNQLDQERKGKEKEKREKRESTLEGFKKGVAGIVSTTKKMLSPFQAIIDRIWRFIFFTLLGRGFTKFMEWMSDKENRKKFESLIEFFVDHWPALVGLYVLFGTSFGKLIRGLLKGATRMIVALAMNAGKIRKFIGKHKKLAFLGLAAAPLVTRELGNIFGENKETPESGLIPRTNPELDSAKKDAAEMKDTKVPTLNQFNQGGIIPKFDMGGMIPTFKIGGMNYPMGDMDFSGGMPITGAGQDDTLIAAKTGEAILTEKDQIDLNQRYIDRNTGQPLDVPQYLAGRKPGTVSMDRIRPKFGGGFSGGGIINRFNTGGVVGGNTVNRFNTGGVVNRFNTGGVVGGNTVNKFNTGGTSNVSAIKIATQHLKQDEALSSLTPGINDFTRPGGPKWAKVGVNTPVYSYSDSVGQPTIGWGSTYYDSILNGKSPVRMGDKITKGRADNILFKNVQSLSTEYSTKISNWNKMTDKQRAGLLLIGYNAPYGPLGSYPKLTNALKEGNMQAAAQNAQRGGPSAHRISIERNLLLSGPTNLKNLVGPKIVGPKIVGSGIPFIPPFMYSPSKVQGKQVGGVMKPIERVEESEGLNIPGATADRQLFPIMGGGLQPLQPDEVVITKLASQRIGYDRLDRINALDPNSEASKRGVKPLDISKNISRPIPQPYRRGRSEMITLPPIMQSAIQNKVTPTRAGTQVPAFSHVSGLNDRSVIAKIYGIEGG